jgi:hypothetical protein
MRPSFCSAWRNFVSAFGENGAVGVFCGQRPEPGLGVDDDAPPHRSNRHCLYRRIFLLAPRHNVQHPIRQRPLKFQRLDRFALQPEVELLSCRQITAWLLSGWARRWRWLP